MKLLKLLKRNKRGYLARKYFLIYTENDVTFISPFSSTSLFGSKKRKAHQEQESKQIR